MRKVIKIKMILNLNLTNLFHVVIIVVMSSLKIVSNQAKDFSILHLNIHSIQKHIEELLIILSALNFEFDIIAISESKLKGEPNVDISLQGYRQPYCTHTDADKGDTSLYVT